MPTVSVTDAGGTYNGQPFAATDSVAGVNGQAGSTLEGVGLTLDYQKLNSSGQVVQDLGSTAPTSAGSYRVTAAFAGSTDYLSASAQTTFSIGQATPTVKVSDAGGTYSGSAFPATDSVAGVNGQAGSTLEGVGLTIDYQKLNGSGQVIQDLGSTAPISAGNYRVTAAFAGSTDYTATSASTTFTINARPITISADAKSKTYGQADPALTYHITAGNLVNGDSFSGALTRAAGEHVTGGPYAILQGTLTAGSNYNLSFIGANLTITPATLTVTADAKSKVYGQADPALTYQATGFQFTDTAATVLSGGLSRAAGEHVAGGPYAIGQGSLAADSDYRIAFTGNQLTITPAPLTVTADAKSKVYGQADPALTYQATGFQFTDTAATVLSGGLSRAAGEHVAGSPYAIGQGSLAADSDYRIAFTGNQLTITPATLTVTADAKSKVYGQADPALTYQATGFQFADGVGNVLTGGLSRAAGEHVAGSPYAISQGTLTADSDYSIAFTGANLTITPAPLTVTADAKSKTSGQPDPALTYTYSGLVNGDVSTTFSGALARAAGENPGSYAINLNNLASSNPDYTIGTYISALFTISNPTTPGDTLSEGNSFDVTVQHTFTVPQQPSTLSFSFEPSFDTPVGNAPPDAFEAALVTADGTSLVHTFRRPATPSSTLPRARRRPGRRHHLRWSHRERQPGRPAGRQSGHADLPAGQQRRPRNQLCPHRSLHHPGDDRQPGGRCPAGPGGSVYPDDRLHIAGGRVGQFRAGVRAYVL